MFKKTLTAAVAALTLVSATVTIPSAAQAGSLGKAIAVGFVGAVIGAALASKAKAGPVPRVVRPYGPGHMVDEDCGFVLRPVFDEFGHKVGMRKVPEC